MGNSASVWLVIVLAVLAANTPFVNERCFAVIPLQRFMFLKPIFFWASRPAKDDSTDTDLFDDDENASGVTTNLADQISDNSNAATLELQNEIAMPIVKPLWLRLIELIVLYFVVGGVAFALESAAGNPFPQGWEFYAINACLFLVLAFPGFVYRYLKRKHG